MNRRLAVAPRCFRDWRDLRYVLEKLGPYQGQYGVDFPAQWKREVHEYAATIGDVEAQRIRELIRIHHRSAFLPSRLHYDRSSSWTKNVTRVQEGASRFDGIVGDIVDPGDFPTVESLELELLVAQRDWRGHGTPAQYVNLAMPLLVSGPELILVDPYFDVAQQRCASVLHAFLAEMRGTRCSRITIWARRAEVLGPRGAASFRQSVERVLKGQPMPADGIRYSLFDDRKSGGREHARYLLTLGGALRFESGLAALPDEVVDISIVDRPVHGSLLSRYAKEDAPLSFERFEFSA